jgi:branched-chain amino acid transport system permease protein
MRLLRRPAFISVLVLVLAAAVGPVLDNYSLSVLSMIAAYVVFAVGYNLLMGVAGQFDFGQGAFLGIGAYAMAVLETRYSVPFPLALPLAGCAAVLAGLVIGTIVLRLGGFYLALVTLGFNQTVVLGLALAGSVTGGFQGMSVPPPAVPGIERNLLLFWIAVTVAVLFAQGAANLLGSRVGLAFRAIRERDVAAQAMGVNLTRYRVMAYGLSAFYDGVAGGLMAVLLSYITPAQFGLGETLKVLTMITVGGMGSVAGSVVGAIVLSLAGEALRFSNLFLEIGDGLLLVIFMVLMPGGICGAAYGLVNRQWRSSKSTISASGSAA